MPSKIKIIFLGTGSAVPTSSRNHTGILLNYGGENVLVDCGEGTQRQFRKANLNPLKLTKLLITHWHGDHVLGIPGLLQTLALNGYNKKLRVYGPKGTGIFMKKILEAFVFINKVNLEIHEIGAGKFFEDSDFYLESFPVMHHSIKSNAYIFVKKGRIKIDKKKLKQSGLPSGPLLQKLKQGKDISYVGKKYKAKDLTFLENSKKISFLLDTKYHKEISNFVKNSDLLISEANFDSSLIKKAEESFHLTAKQAAEIAKKSNSKKLFLTHISQRYEKNPDVILKEAKKVFKNSYLAKDLESVEV